MLQQAAFKPARNSFSSFFLVDHNSKSFQALPARMSIARDSSDVNQGLYNEVVQQEEDIRRNVITDFFKDQSGMTAKNETPSNRGYKDLRRERDVVFTGDYVEQEGALRGCKRRGVSVERESRSQEYIEKDQQLVNSGSSDLTTEHSAICMAAESNSTRTTGSFEEDGCLLKLQSTTLVAAGYDELHPNDKKNFDDEEEDNSSLPVPNTLQITCARRYDVLGLAGRASSYDCHIAGQESQDWLAASSYEVKRPASSCASFDNNQQDNKARDDWLELRLGSNFLALHMSSSTSSSSPCTLQLLPQEPDCALMKEREKHGELTLFTEDFARKPLIYKQAELPSMQGKPPSVLQSSVHIKNINMREDDFYTSLMRTSCLPLASADSSEQLTAIPATPSERPTDVSMLYPPLQSLDHHASNFAQQRQGAAVRNRASLDPLRSEQRPFESTSLRTCVSLQGVQDAQEAIQSSAVSRPPVLPDFVHQNWDQLASSSPAFSMMQPVTSFRDLVASSILKEPCHRYNGNIPLLTSGQQTAIKQTWPAKFSSQISMLNDPTERVNTSNENNYMNSMNMGCKSMTSWLSEALASTENLYVDRGLDDQLSPEASLTPSLISRRQNNAERKRMTKSSSQPLLRCVSRPASRGSPGFWFALQPSKLETYDAEIRSEEVDAKAVSYIRMKNGDVPISAVKKFLITKLRLSHDSQVGLACRGKLLEEAIDLKSIQEEIWLSHDFVHKERLSFRSSHSKIHTFKDNIMILTYQIS